MLRVFERGVGDDELRFSVEMSRASSMVIRPPGLEAIGEEEKSPGCRRFFQRGLRSRLRRAHRAELDPRRIVGVVKQALRFMVDFQPSTITATERRSRLAAGAPMTPSRAGCGYRVAPRAGLHRYPRRDVMAHVSSRRHRIFGDLAEDLSKAPAVIVKGGWKHFQRRLPRHASSVTSKLAALTTGVAAPRSRAARGQPSSHVLPDRANPVGEKRRGSSPLLDLLAL